MNIPPALRHVTKISDLTRKEIVGVLKLALEMKKEPQNFADALKGKSLLMLFEKPSLRTRVSLETGMTQMGGHAIAYMTGDSPIGQKESYEDTGAVLSRMVNGVTARVKSREQIQGLARTSKIPIINALDDFGHPMQLLADLLTICEHHLNSDPEKFQGLRLAYLGDCQNNVTYDIMRAGSIMDIDVRIAGPFASMPIEDGVMQECQSLGPPPTLHDSAEQAVRGAHVVYTDSWMSYGIQGAEREKRFKTLLPYQVTTDLMKYADPKASFMNCLPAMRGEEQTAQVIDGPQSVVFDQAENRLHAQKALILKLMSTGL
mmetsp:Transcript_21784/g.28209  ORF Transcript_21784/g.28209 Transcript_21784/m.28209 type:complete len:317 (+) Transcript_21784:77-1027(+)